MLWQTELRFSCTSASDVVGVSVVTAKEMRRFGSSGMGDPATKDSTASSTLRTHGASYSKGSAFESDCAQVSSVGIVRHRTPSHCAAHDVRSSCRHKETLPLLSVLCHENVWRSGGTEPCIRNLITTRKQLVFFTPWPLYPRRNCPLVPFGYEAG
jgi:hypothetical protein